MASMRGTLHATTSGQELHIWQVLRLLFRREEVLTENGRCTGSLGREHQPFQLVILLAF